MTLTKTADAATVNAGDAIGFTITASNTGACDATSFVLSDPLPNLNLRGHERVPHVDDLVGRHTADRTPIRTVG